MSKTVRDIFTAEEWELLAQELLPQLKEIANLPVPEEKPAKEAGHDV